MGILHYIYIYINIYIFLLILFNIKLININSYFIILFQIFKLYNVIITAK